MVPQTRALIPILTGTTASGKSALALEYALSHGNIELINADSIQLYRGFDIGSAKSTLEERACVPHHLIDVCNPEETFTAGDFVRKVDQTITEILEHGKRPLLVGGTGFYLKALLHGLWDAPAADPRLRALLSGLPREELYKRLEKIDPTSAHRITPGDPYRLIRALEIHALTGKTPTELEQAPKVHRSAHAFKLIVIDREQEELEARIRTRAQAMLAQGLIEETTRLLREHPSARALEAVGYAQVVAHLRGEKPKGRELRPGTQGLIDEITLATRQLVKRQRTWFRGQSKAHLWILDRERQSVMELLNDQS
jgi:tRNA dimethylallyltransferase